MLKEVNQDIVYNMGSDDNTPVAVRDHEHVAIHQTNVLQATKLSVKLMAVSPNKTFLVALRIRSKPYSQESFSKLDIYDITFRSHPKFMFSMIENEDITGLAWLDDKHIISASKQATINIYSLKLGVKTKVYTTDYGPVTSMKYSTTNCFLLTGTEYGYAVGYRISNSGSQISCDKKMVKITGSIISVDLHILEKEVPMEVDACAVEGKKAKSNATKSSWTSSRKRRRSDSSEESDADEIDERDDATSEFLANCEITIYGVSDNKIVVWDYHKMRILDSIVRENKVTCLLALKNGNFVVGDSEGVLSIYDHKTFTCRQNEKILKSTVTCLALGAKDSILLAAGIDREPVITLLKTNASSESQDEFILFERLKDHDLQVNSALFVSRKVFFTCSDDDLIIKFRFGRSDGTRTLKRYKIKSDDRSRIHFGNNELMTMANRSLHIYKIEADLQLSSQIETFPTRRTLPEPRKICTVQVNNQVRAATFDEKWICYSTDGGITITRRPGLNKLHRPSQNLPNCHILKLCQSGRYLIAGQQRKILVTRLSGQTIEPGENERHTDMENGCNGSEKREPRRVNLDEVSSVFKTILIAKLKGMIRDIIYHQRTGRLIISCGTTRHFLYVLKLPIESHGDGDISDQTVSFLHKLSLPSSPLSIITFNYLDPDDTSLYMLTAKNQLVKCDIEADTFKFDMVRLVNETEPISELQKDLDVKGIALQSRNHCMIYDSNQIYKIDLNTNQLVSATPEYNNINVVSNTIFGQAEEILIV